MKLALPAQPHHPLHFHLSDRARELLLSACRTLLPYAVAALGVFAYHEQWFS